MSILTEVYNISINEGWSRSEIKRPQFQVGHILKKPDFSQHKIIKVLGKDHYKVRHIYTGHESEIKY